MTGEDSRVLVQESLSEIIISASLMDNYDLNFITLLSEAHDQQKSEYLITIHIGVFLPLLERIQPVTHSDPLMDSHSHSKLLCIVPITVTKLDYTNNR